MTRKCLMLSFVFLTCLITAGSGADEEPARVMNFIAVMDLSCGNVANKDECTVLTDIVIEEVVKSKKYTVIDRANRDKILSEVGFQQTGCVDESCTVEAGRLLGVGKIIVGKVTKFGESYIVSLQLINVETAAVEVAAKEICKKCELDGLLTTTTNAARNLMGQEPVPISQPGSQPTELSSVGAFFEVIDKGDVKSAEAMLEENPDLINSRSSGMTPLHMAAFGGQLEITKLLLKYGANPNAIERSGAGVGLTPLHVLAMECRTTEEGLKVAEVLIENGANLRIKAGILGTPIKMAKKCEDKSLYNFLVKQRGK